MSPDDPRATRSGEGLRVGTFNLRYATPADGPNAWAERRDLVVSLLRYHRPAVLGLQEVLPGQRADLAEALAEYEFVGRGRRADGGGERVLVAYRPGAVGAGADGTFWLSETPDEPGSNSWGAAHPRIATWLEVEWGGRDLLVCATHLDHESATARERGARLLRRRLADLAEGRPTVLLGDLNCEPGSMPYRLLIDAGEGRGFRDARNVAEQGHHGPEGTFHEFTGTATETIDHVLLTDEFRVRQHAVLADTDGKRYPSDHFPVVVDVVGVAGPESSGVSRR